ncbi:trypsin-like peptidase domain-containing protein [Rhodospirillum rubrum]|uniref:trypsin-like peptidase domain-containing protein n=1 Tax=Rhodospirillum rubrum TaxID=1085 RepID=UPI001F5B0A98|nr:trypsin-like peptidase domain-containing protein [Rhodospirillum rubrum]
MVGGAALVLSTIVPAGALPPAPAVAGASPGPSLALTPVFMVGEEGVLTLAPTLEIVTPAVVNIAVKATVAARPNPLLADPLFRQFFGVPPGAESPRERTVVSAGSGVIVDAARGTILTNHHVIDGAEDITVTLKDRRVLKATLLGSDPGTDIAVLRVKADRLTALHLADSDRAQVGDLTIAIGNPFGLGQTVTTGVISAKGRSGVIPDGYEDFLQTDASINPGNSGGALVNSRGDLVGINTAILSSGGGNVGIGFAIPSNIARAVMEQILKDGTVRRGHLGVSIQTVSPVVAESLGLPRAAGVIIAAVERGSTAEKVGLRTGDVILAVDGRPSETAEVLRRQIGLAQIGDRVRLTVMREGKSFDLQARIGS